MQNIIPNKTYCENQIPPHIQQMLDKLNLKNNVQIKNPMLSTQKNIKDLSNNIEGEKIQGEKIQGEKIQGEKIQGEKIQGEKIQGEKIQGEKIEGEKETEKETEKEIQKEKNEKILKISKIFGDFIKKNNMTLEDEKIFYEDLKKINSKLPNNKLIMISFEENNLKIKTIDKKEQIENTQEEKSDKKMKEVSTYNFNKNMWYISLSFIILTILITLLLLKKWKDN